MLKRRFYSRHSPLVAPELIGKILVRKLDDLKLIRGIIVETEAYTGSDDPASHAYRGLTPRTQVMFGKAGIAYVYFTYGFHNCLNVVTGKLGEAEAVLIRAIEPIDGIEFMRKQRKNPIKDLDIANGPGKICQAFAIDRDLNGLDLTRMDSPLFIDEPTTEKVQRKVVSSSRIGIRNGFDKKWRFYDEESQFVSARANIISS